MTDTFSGANGEILLPFATSQTDFLSRINFSFAPLRRQKRVRKETYADQQGHCGSFSSGAFQPQVPSLLLEGIGGEAERKAVFFSVCEYMHGIPASC